MLGHGISSRILLVREGPLVRRVEHWRRIWCDAGSKKPKDYSIFHPLCNDPDFLPCGVVFVFGADNFAEPKDDLPVGLVHKSLLELAPPAADMWSDDGRDAIFQVTLRPILKMGTAWPSATTLLERPPPAMQLMLDLEAVATPSSPDKLSGSGARPLPLFIRNTFVDFPDEVNKPSHKGLR